MAALYCHLNNSFNWCPAVSELLETLKTFFSKTFHTLFRVVIQTVSHKLFWRQYHLLSETMLPYQAETALSARRCSTFSHCSTFWPLVSHGKTYRNLHFTAGHSSWLKKMGMFAKHRNSQSLWIPAIMSFDDLFMFVFLNVSLRPNKAWKMMKSSLLGDQSQLEGKRCYACISNSHFQSPFQCNCYTWHNPDMYDPGLNSHEIAPKKAN